MKLFKKIAASVLACTLLMGSVSMIASAFYVPHPDVYCEPSSTTKPALLMITNSRQQQVLLQTTLTAYNANGGYVSTKSNQALRLKNQSCAVSDSRTATKRSFLGTATAYNGQSSQTGTYLVRKMYL